jgi:hypothetical protein
VEAGASRVTIAKQSVGQWVRTTAQGWAGEKGDQNDRAMHPSQVAGKAPSTLRKGETKRALLPGLALDRMAEGAVPGGGYEACIRARIPS